MSKEYLEAWNFIKDQMSNFTFSHLVTEMAKNADIVDNALHRLESIDNANPSEALEVIENIIDNYCRSQDVRESDRKEYIDVNLNVIKQALLKAQEQEKENVYEEE